jgi:tryptophan synthase alpha chain
VSRLAVAFAAGRKEKRASLIVYLMAGDPNLRTTEDLALACEAGGADILELGIPFSDPIADGSEIRQASERALRSGTRPHDVLDLAARLREQTRMPLVLMTYANPVLAMGVSRFAADSAASGVDGVILPDVSLEGSGEFREPFDQEGLDHIQLVSPSTPLGRAAEIGRASRGFLYVVAWHGTTGVRSNLPEDLPSRIRSLHGVTQLPLAVGFGVSTRGQVRALAAAGADGVVVGSAIIRLASEDRHPARVQQFVGQLAAGLAHGRAAVQKHGQGTLPGRVSERQVHVPPLHASRRRSV